MKNDWIVVVDDDSQSLMNAKNLLDSDDMRVSCLRSGRDLLKFMEKNSPDLILLDILMPEMDGFETYHALRQFEDQSGITHIPVIFLSGENDSEIERRGLKAGASDFIHKPFDKDIIIKRIKNTIRNNKIIESLTEEAKIDKLTGFLNKVSGTQSLTELCKSQTGALVILDLDSFKLVNDLFGHDMGDRVLRAFADIVRYHTREKDTVCRIGGDEFMAFFSNLTEEESVAALTERLNRTFFEEAEKLMGKDFGIPLGISVGVAMVPLHGRSFETLFSKADKSLYIAKQNGKHGYCIYTQAPDAEIGKEVELERELARITKIMEERNDSGGGLLLGQESFSIIYRYMERFHKRYGGSVTKMLYVLTPKSRNDMKFLEAASDTFIAVLQDSLRKSDLIMQYKLNQFFLLLPELSEDDVSVVTGRIMSKWQTHEICRSIDIEYITKSM